MAEETQTDVPNSGITPEPAADGQNAPQFPSRFDRVDWLGFVATTLIALVGYLFTLAPNVTLEWSGVLSTGAAYAGVGPPPGHPVLMLYSWCFIELLPISNIAWRVAVGSAVASAVACGLVAIMVSRGGLVSFQGSNRFEGLSARELVWLRLVCGAVAGLVLGFSGLIWDFAVVAETRSLSLLLFVVVVALFFRWSLEPQHRRFLFGAFFAVGLLLTNGQEFLVLLPGLLGAIMLIQVRTGRDVTLFVLPLAVLVTVRNQTSLWDEYPNHLNWPLLIAICAVGLAALLLVITARSIGNEWKCALGCGLALLLGLAFYLYVPLASMTTPPVNWGYPRTVDGFWHTISRGQWGRLYPVTDFGRFSGQIWPLLAMTGRQFGWLYLALALVPLGFFRSMTNRGRCLLAGFMVIWTCATLLMLAELNPPPDRQAWENVYDQYFAASHAILAVWLGLGLMIVGAKFAGPSQINSSEPHSPQSSR